MKIKYYNRDIRKDSGSIRDGTNNHHLHIFVEENQKNLHREGDNRIGSWDIYVVLPKGVGHSPLTPTKKRQYPKQMLGRKHSYAWFWIMKYLFERKCSNFPLKFFQRK